MWLAEPDALLASIGSIDEALRLLDADELGRYRAFHFDRDRDVYLAAHLLLRHRLSHYAPVGPGQWVFEKSAYGRPELAGPALACQDLRFNLSHTDGLVACAITNGADIGVDVEALSRPTPGLDIAERFFSRQEYDRLRQAPAAQQHELFFGIWTLKEAYVKARGMGLSLPLDQFSFDLDLLDIRGVRFRETLNDKPEKWRFDVRRVVPQHMMGLAVRATGTEEVAIRIHRLDMIN